MAKDVFFLDHRHAEESGGDDSVSKTNTYEVRRRTMNRLPLTNILGQAKMIKDLVLYFLKYLAEFSFLPSITHYDFA